MIDRLAKLIRPARIDYKQVAKRETVKRREAERALTEAHNELADQAKRQAMPTDMDPEELLRAQLAEKDREIERVRRHEQETAEAAAYNLKQAEREREQWRNTVHQLEGHAEGLDERMVEAVHRASQLEEAIRNEIETDGAGAYMLRDSDRPGFVVSRLMDALSPEDGERICPECKTRIYRCPTCGNTAHEPEEEAGVLVSMLCETCDEEMVREEPASADEVKGILKGREQLAQPASESDGGGVGDVPPDLHGMEGLPFPEFGDDDIRYLERVTLPDREQAITALAEHHCTARAEHDPQPIFMQWVEGEEALKRSGGEADSVWLECGARNPDAVPFWKDDPSHPPQPQTGPGLTEDDCQRLREIATEIDELRDCDTRWRFDYASRDAEFLRNLANRKPTDEPSKPDAPSVPDQLAEVRRIANDHLRDFGEDGLAQEILAALDRQPDSQPVGEEARPECDGSGRIHFPHLARLSGPEVGGPFDCPGCPRCQPAPRLPRHIANTPSARAAGDDPQTAEEEQRCQPALQGGGELTGVDCEGCGREQHVGDEGWESRDDLTWCPDCFVWDRQWPPLYVTQFCTRPDEPEPEVGYQAHTDPEAAEELERNGHGPTRRYLPAPPDPQGEQGADLTINGVPAAKFVKRAYDLGDDLNGPGRFDLDDPVQRQLRAVKGWIEQAERDALNQGKHLSRTTQQGRDSR